MAQEAGLDAYHKSIACANRCQKPTGRVRNESRAFGTTTYQLRDLAEDLKSHRVTEVALGSIGVLSQLFKNIHKDDTEYKDLGRDNFDRLAPERLQRYYIRRLESLGVAVTVKLVPPQGPAA